MNQTLETYRSIIGYNPYHFWQLANKTVPVVSSCDTLLTKYPWQDNAKLSRDDMIQAINAAENRLREFLGYRIGADHIEKTVQYPVTKTDQWDVRGPKGRLKSVNVGEGFLRCLGVELFTVVELDTAATYSDSNGDTLIDLFEATATIPADLAYDELAVYVPEAQWLQGWSREDARIEPLDIKVDGTAVTISGKSWIMVDPIKYEGVVISPIDPNDTNNYLQTVDVYAITTSAAGTNIQDAPVILRYEQRNYTRFLNDYGTCSDSIYWDNYTVTGSGETAVYNVPASGVIRDYRLGEVGIAAHPQPDRVTVRFLAGAQFKELNSTKIYSGEWDRIIAAFASAEAGRPICSCKSANRAVAEWQTDRALISGRDGEAYSISENDLNNPFGTKRGQIYAYKMVQNLKITRGFAL